MFAVLAAFWGASYLFIKVALEDHVPPATIVCARTLLAALVLLPLALHRDAIAGLRPFFWPIVLVAVIQVAAPFMLITIGERELSSSLTGILVATAPIFTFLLAFAFEGEERAGAVSMTGVVIGLAGVALLLGLDTGGGSAALVGGLLVVLASFGYALGAWLLKRMIHGTQPVGVVAATMSVTGIITLPLVAIDPPASVPGLEAVGSLLALGILGTGVAFLIFYTLMAQEGPARTSLVAYVAPGFSVIYGVVLLDESFTVNTALGLLLILGGSWLAAEGGLPWNRRRRELAREAASARAPG